VKCHEYGNELEASIAVAVLDMAGIPSIVRSNDSVGLFGSAFQGYSAMGVSLLVPSPALAAAKTVLANARPATDDASAAGDDD
jgi:ABC-type phosphate transport system permease subunit